MIKRNFLLAIFTFLISSFAFGQLTEVDITQRTQQANKIVEGKVVSQFSFWDDQHHNIYTASKIEVYKQFKGNMPHPYLEVITPGGTIGMVKETVEPSLKLRVGAVGVFFLKTNQIAISQTMFTTARQFQPAAGPQGLITYDASTGHANDAFQQYNNVGQDVHQTIEAITGTNFIKVKKYTFTPEVTSLFKASSISSFTPTTATAGTATTITITGTDFGSTAGTVRFSNADDGGATFIDGLATEIISWNPTTIVVEVNGDAGTGTIQVVGNGTATSSQTLTVPYSQLNANFDPGSGTEAYQTRHIDRDGSGGYVWNMHTDFDASAGNAAFVRSLDSWRCSTGINWTIGATTTTDVVANDDINIIRFDNGGELPGGVLGRCTSRWSGCGGATIEWYVEELDIVFDDGTNWNFTTSAPGGSQYDFESVSVHELGHGHQLGHVINSNDVMHYAISNGEQNRTPSANNLAGASDVQSRSTGGSVCSQTVMTSYSCGSAPVADFSGTPTSICPGATVTFTDLSTNTPTSWSWSFGDGGSSTSQNPTYAYPTAGSYTVTLTATNASGSDDEIKTGYITVNALPNVSSTSSTDETCTGNDGTATVTPSGGSGNYTYLWTPSSQTTATATGLAAGTYDVTVTDAVSGCSDATSVNVNDGCTGTPPVADFTSDFTAGCEQFTINFTDLSTNTPTSWSWDFGDGNSSTAQNPSNFYVNPGSYTVTLTATNAFGSDPEVKSGYITIYSDLTLGTSSTDETCAGNDGTATVSPSGGSSNYGFLWDASAGSQTTATATGLAAGTYGVVVSDITSGCSYPTNVTVSDGCAPSIPTTSLRIGYCGSTLAAMNTYLKCYGVSGADLYEFRIVNSALGYDETIPGLSNPLITALTYAPNILANTTYDITVRARVGGNFGNFGSVCQVTTPGSTPASVPLTRLRDGFCGLTMVAMNSTLKCYGVSSADLYEFRFVNAATGFDVTINGVSSNPIITSFYHVPGVQVSTTYDVTVRARVGGSFGNFGPVCQVTTPATAALTGGGGTASIAIGNPSNGNMLTENDEAILQMTPELRVYPNPNEGNEIALVITNLNNEIHNTQVEVLDLSGKRVFIQNDSFSGNEIRTRIQFNEQLPAGIYLVRFVVDNNVIHQKMSVN